MPDDRESFLGRIRQAVAAVPAGRRTPRPDVPASTLRQIEPAADRVTTFCEQAKAMGLIPSVTDEPDVGHHVAQILRTEGAFRLAFEPDLAWMGAIRAAFPEATVLDPARGDETFYGADVGITGAVHAVAETGSLVVDTAAGRWRSLSLIPPLHVVIIRASQIVPDLVDLFSLHEDPAQDSLAAAAAGARGLLASDLPSNITIITGPSKTADIEGVLVTGIHGPCKVYVVVVQDTVAFRAAGGQHGATDPSVR